MLGLARMQIDCRSACRRECGGYIHGNLTGLAHAGRHELAPPTVHTLYDGLDRSLVGIGHRDSHYCFTLSTENPLHRAFYVFIHVFTYFALQK